MKMDRYSFLQIYFSLSIIVFVNLGYFIYGGR